MTLLTKSNFNLMPNLHSSHDEKLALALQLAGLQQQQEQVDQRTAGDRLHQALALMGLMQQGKDAEAQRAFQQQQLAQTGEFHLGELQNQQQQLKQTSDYQTGEIAARNTTEANRQGEYWGGQLPMHYAGQASETADRAATRELAQQQLKQTGDYQTGMLAHQTAADATAKSAQDRMLHMEVIKELMKNDLPGGKINPLALAYMQKSLPDFAPIYQQQHDQDVAGAVSTNIPIVQNLYDMNGKDPKMLKTALDSLAPKMGADAYAALPWNEFGQHMAVTSPQESWLSKLFQSSPTVSPPAQPVSTSATSPSQFPGSTLPEGQHGVDWGRLGHLLKTFGGLVPDVNTASPEQLAIWEAQRQRAPKPQP